jgi:uncharacterized protein
VWVADWYNFISQHNPTPPGYSNGPGNAYETSMRDRQRGRIYSVVYKDAPPSPRLSLSTGDAAGLAARARLRQHALAAARAALLVERGATDVVPQLIALARNTAVDAIGTNGAALHALWTLHGLGALASHRLGGGSHGRRRARPPGGGRSEGRGDGAAARRGLGRGDPRGRAAAGSRPAHPQGSAILALADLPPSAAVGEALYKASQDPENFRDRWLSRALHIAAVRQGEAFLTHHRADPGALAPGALPVALRMGASTPDWRTPDAASLGSDWKTMDVPGAWEARGLPDFDGIVWFTRTVEWPAGSRATSLALGRIGNIAAVWIDGQLLTAPPPASGGRPVPRIYGLPEGLLGPGTHTITVRIRNVRSDGGFLGAPEDMYIQGAEHKVPLAGPWQYRVERQTNAATLYASPGELAAHVAAAGAKPAGTLAESLPEPTAPSTPDVVVRLGVVPHELKFDKAELRVEAGQVVELVFTNTDTMPHNFLLGAPGSLEAIGAAADVLMTAPDGAAQQYIPAIPQVLFSTALLDPGQSVTVQFRAPEQPGRYPYVCTFPAHWRIMNGVMHVTGRSEP